MNKRFAPIAICFLVTPVCAFALPATGQNPNPYLKPDESWISLSGKIDSVQRGAFTLNYKNGAAGSIKVEVDDWDWRNEAKPLKAGQKVTVYGEIDDDLFETRTIEASSVYVQDLGTYFYASSADEEIGDYDYWVDYDPIEIGRTNVRGTVTSIDGREFTVNTGLRRVSVDTDEMAYNPLDNEGYHRIDVGDYVSITGNVDDDFWEGTEIKAKYIVSLYNNGRH